MNVIRSGSNVCLFVVTNLIFVMVGCTIVRVPIYGLEDREITRFGIHGNSTEERKTDPRLPEEVTDRIEALDQRITNYLIAHPTTPVIIQDYLMKGYAVIRGMSKEQVLILLGPPAKIVETEKGKEIWWYDEFTDRQWLFYPTSWIWLLFHPHYLFDWPTAMRDEVYFNGDIVIDLEYFGGYVDDLPYNDYLRNIVEAQVKE